MVATEGEPGRGKDKQVFFLCNTWEKRNERPNVQGVSIRSRIGCSVSKGMRNQ